MADQTGEEREAKRGALHRPLVYILAGVILALAFFWGFRLLARSWTHESTDDAFTEGHIIYLAPKVAGQVGAVHVKENQAVTNGEVLVEIDPRDYKVKLAQKQAAVKAASANRATVLASFELVKARVTTAEAAAKQSESEATASQATSEKTEADLKRISELRQRNVVAPQEFDAAKSAAAAGVANLAAARDKAASDLSKVAEARAQLAAAKTLLDQSSAQVHQAELDVEAAELDVSYTKIIAPEDGRVARKSVEPGAYVQIGQTLLALVPSHIWVVANFKETQLKNVRPGLAATLKIDALDRTFRGHVDSIHPGSGARFSLIPPENAVGNYVKVVQRVPVKIVFDHLPAVQQVLGPALSVVPSVTIREWHIPVVVMPLVALLLAAALTFLGWRLLGRRRE